MKIFATKKALDYFSVDHESQKIDESFNQWAMMLKRVNRRNLLLLMHIPSRYLVIFFGFKKPKKDKHEPFIYNLMREFCESKSQSNSQPQPTPSNSDGFMNIDTDMDSSPFN